MPKYNDWEPRSIQDERRKLTKRIQHLQTVVRDQVANGDHPERVDEVDELIARTKKRLDMIAPED